MTSRDDVVALAITRFGTPNAKMSTQRELRFGHKGSLSVALDGDKAGCFYDHEGKRGGRITEPFQDGPPRVQRRPLLDYDSATAEKCQAAIAESCAIDDPSAPDGRAGAYLRSRGITGAPFPSVRAWGRGGIVYAATDVNGTVLACQVMHLHPDGTKDHAADPVLKRTYARAYGWHHFAAVRLPGRGVPILCEGIETGLSIWLALKRPVMCCMGGNGFRYLRTGTKRITIAADGDKEDSPAYQLVTSCVEYRKTRGQKVHIARPPVGKDWNDIHRELGLETVSYLIRRGESA